MSPLGILPHHKGGGGGGEGVSPHLEEFNKHAALPDYGMIHMWQDCDHKQVVNILFYEHCDGHVLAMFFVNSEDLAAVDIFLLKKVFKVVNRNAYHVILSRINCDLAGK